VVAAGFRPPLAAGQTHPRAYARLEVPPIEFTLRRLMPLPSNGVLPMRRTRPSAPELRLEPLEDRCNPSVYLATDLVSDQPGVAPITDPHLVNAWGISFNPTRGAFWVSSNGEGLSTLYSGDVNAVTPPIKFVKNGLEVTIPQGDPTGQVANTTSDFVITDGNGHSGAPAFIFATENGIIAGWNPGVPPTTPPPSKQAFIGFQSQDGAVYKGLAIGSNKDGNFLFAADFHNGKIDVLDKNYKLTTLDGDFSVPGLPSGYAPFGIQAIGDKLYVTYAKQDAAGHDEVDGKGLGFVAVFDTEGHFQGPLISGKELNAPWGLAIAPQDFGQFGGALLVGNFGDGHINAFDPTSGKFLGQLMKAPGQPLVIDGLWGITFGNGKSAGDTSTLYYAAGPDSEAHGLFGKITANPDGTNPVTANLTATGDLVINGSRDSDFVTVRLTNHGQSIVVDAGGQKIGTFNTADVGTIHFTGLAGDDVFLVDPRITARVFADGGAGNDFLTTGSGGGVLLGGPGNDVLVGGAGRDILIGGTGSDALFGTFGDDVLISGTTDFDGNQAALTQLLDTWSSSMSYNARVAALQVAQTTGGPALNATTVHADGVRNDLFGGPGLDLFFAQLTDHLHRTVPAETVITIS
jgi:uncharacterized protein (TIGR03118 family)